MGFIQVAQRRFGIAGELLSFFARNKRWWMLPMVFVVLLLTVVCIPLCLIALFITEDYRVCAECGIKLG